MTLHRKTHQQMWNCKNLVGVHIHFHKAKLPTRLWAAAHPHTWELWLGLWRQSLTDFPTAAPVNCALPQGSYQQGTGSAGSENKVYVTLVQNANILFSLSSQEIERLNPLRMWDQWILEGRIKMSLNEICWKCFVFISKCWLNVNTNKWLINLSFTHPQSWINW